MAQEWQEYAAIFLQFCHISAPCQRLTDGVHLLYNMVIYYAEVCPYVDRRRLERL